jgi:hypothetical protein
LDLEARGMGRTGIEGGDMDRISSISDELEEALR